MSLPIILISLVSGLFIIVTIAMIGLWHSYRQDSMLGGLVLMWVVIIICFLVVFFSGRKTEARKEVPNAKPDENLLQAPSLSFPKL